MSYRACLSDISIVCLSGKHRYFRRVTANSLQAVILAYLSTVIETLEELTLLINNNG